MIAALALVLVPVVASSGAVQSSAGGRAAACANDNVPLSTLSAGRVRAAVVCLVDQERRRFGLPALRQNRRLDRAAQRFSDEMVARDFFSHDAPAPHASRPPQRIRAAGYHWEAWGEDLATGYPTAVAAVSAWMSDVGHCQNILFPLYRDIGVGFVNRALPRYSSSPALWTNDFALRRGRAAPSRQLGPANTCPHGL